MLGDENYFFFFWSHVSRKRNRQWYLMAEWEKSRWFLRAIQGSIILPKLWNKLSTHFCSALFWTWCRAWLLKGSVSPCFSVWYVVIHFFLFLNHGIPSANLRYTAVGCWPNLLVFPNYDAIYDSLFDFLLLWCVFQPEDVMKNISRIASPLSWYLVWEQSEGLKWHHQNHGRRLTMHGCVLI